MTASVALVNAALGGQLLRSEEIIRYIAYTTYAGDPTGNLTPEHLGQRCLDTVGGVFYDATTAASSGWKLSSTALSETDLTLIDGITAGTVAASKAVVVDANKDISAFRTVGLVNLDAGSSGTAGTVDVFPSTAAKGKLAITAADSAGDTTTTVVNASQSGTRTYTIPDAGASASFVMTAGAQTLAGALTLSAGVIFGAGATLDADSGTAAASSNAGTISKMAGKLTTEALTTAGLAGQVLTITNTTVAATDHIFCSVANGTNTQGAPGIGLVAPGSGSFTVDLRNRHATEAFNGTLVVSFFVVKA